MHTYMHEYSKHIDIYSAFAHTHLPTYIHTVLDPTFIIMYMMYMPGDLATDESPKRLRIEV